MVYYKQIPNTNIRLRNTDIIAAHELANRAGVDIKIVLRAYVVTWALGQKTEPPGGVTEWIATFFSRERETAKEQLEAYIEIGSSIGILDLDGLE